MDGSQSLSPFPEGQSRDEIEAWLEARSAALSSLIAGEILRITSEAFEAFAETVDETAVTAAGDPSAVDSIIPKWNLVAQSIVAPAVQETYLAGSLFAYTIADGKQAIPLSVAQGWQRVINAQAAQYASEATNRLRGVGDTLWKDIRRKVTSAIEQGTSGEALKEEIEALGKFSEFRADTIGRTETSIAYSNGNFASDQALGEFGPLEKIWVAVGDARTRPAHLAAMSASEASPVPFSEPFSVGGVQMMFPHSPGAPAGEVVNCRCFYEALYAGDRRPDGSIVQPAGAAQPEAPVQPPVIGRVSDEDSILPAEGSLRVDQGYDDDEAREYARSLSSEQSNVVMSYTRSSTRINTALRNADTLTEDEYQFAQTLDAAIARAEPKQRVTYRGITIDDPSFRFADPRDWVAARYTPGDVVDLGGSFSSTTTNPKMALAYADATQPVIYEIESYRGAPIKFASVYDDEDEILLGRRSIFEVVRIEDADIRYTASVSIKATMIVLREVMMP